MTENPAERSAEADLAVCEAATPGEWVAERTRLDDASQVTIRDIVIGEFDYHRDAALAVLAHVALPYWIADAQAERAERERLAARVAELESVLTARGTAGDCPHGFRPTHCLHCRVAELEGRAKGAAAGVLELIRYIQGYSESLWIEEALRGILAKLEGP